MKLNFLANNSERSLFVATTLFDDFVEPADGDVREEPDAMSGRRMFSDWENAVDESGPSGVSNNAEMKFSLEASHQNSYLAGSRIPPDLPDRQWNDDGDMIEQSQTRQSRIMRNVVIIVACAVLLLLAVCVGRLSVAGTSVFGRSASAYTHEDSDQKTRHALDALNVNLDKLSLQLPPLEEFEVLSRSSTEKLENIEMSLRELKSAIHKVTDLGSTNNPQQIHDKANQIHLQVNQIQNELREVLTKLKQAEDREHVMLAPLESVSPLLPILTDRFCGRQAADYVAVDNSLKGLLLLSPQDARMWYLAAVTRGYRSKEWSGAAKEFALFGASLEKLGQPSKLEVDEYLTRFPSDAKSWVNQFRRDLPQNEARAPK